jgi:hypothetical protein
MLSGKYTEIGVAVVEGDLNGEDTTLIVQLFGTKSSAAPSVSIAAAEVGPSQSTTSEPVLAQNPEAEVGSNAQIKPLLATSRFDVMKVITLGVVGAMVLILAIDVVVITRRGITRTGGRAFAHLSFMVMVLIILMLARGGEII